ncbi:transglutaminase-like domain-containing protein [Sphingobacterium sp. UT-1RO-CII-1]|uniref:transglutaminase-like domain-containing protein n=1 Tax=Sphingobacterium sp. UT-1RO-CII-1 TaxID=2995225 RepID=UPI00227ADB04|nr:transglutaminase-like domain-containing protein [Sphingobacterium sp. UT-1RO-CII-1]MCY4778314.1 transglutaminase-like domain-containing protein [Sphingobacterium sp. UT-1RO-CII-1]
MMSNNTFYKKITRLKKCLFIICSIGFISTGCKKQNEAIDWKFLYEHDYPEEDKQLAYKFIEQLENQFYKTYSLKNGLVNEDGEKIDIDYSDFGTDSSLLRYLNKENLNFSSTPYQDKDLITAAEIAQEIKHALQLRRRYTWAKKVPEDLYINYVMPYKIDHEIPHNWRTFFYQKQQKMLDSLEKTSDNTVENAAQLIADNIYSWYYYDEGHIPRSQYPTLSEILFSDKGDCFRISRLFVYAMRAAGIPATIDNVPYWGSKNGSHSDFVSLDSTGHLRTNVTTLHKNFLRKAAKVLRRTAFYQGNYSEKYVALGVENDPNFPSFLKNDFFIDVTDQHTLAYNLKYDLPDAYKNAQYAYVCVYNYGEWKPIDVAKNEKGSLIFPKMTANILYRIAVVENEKLNVFSEVIYQDENGRIQKIKPDKKNKQKININKYNDGSEAYVSPNSWYTLYYIKNDGNWEKLHRQQSTTDSLIFHDVPSTTLYKIVNESEFKNNLERPFEIVENNIIWW